MGYRGSERPAAHTQQKLTHVPVPPPGCLAAVATQTRAAKETGLVMHSFNCKWFLGITVLAWLRGVAFLAKPEKPLNELGGRIRKTAFIVDKNRKPKAKLEKIRKPHEMRKPENRAIFESENRKTEPKIGQIRKTEDPNAPLII